MTKHPDVQERVQEELDMNVGDISPLSFQQIEKLRYFNAVWKESMRFNSTSPIGTTMQSNLAMYSPFHRGFTRQY
jgi:cytochrome P450